MTTVDAEPLPLYRESPTWALDATALAYIQVVPGQSRRATRSRPATCSGCPHRR